MPIHDSRKQTGSCHPAKPASPSLALLTHLSFKQKASSLQRKTFFKEKQIQIEEQPLSINVQSKFPHLFKSLPKLKGRVKV